jgi:hypothetical protein
MRGNTVFPAGAETSDAVIVTESAVALGRNVSVAVADVAVTESPTEAVPSVTVRVSMATDADAGATVDSKPKPKAATVTNAMRLKVVVVDICFLSVVDPREIRSSAWNQSPDSARFIARADESNSPPCIRTR